MGLINCGLCKRATNDYDHCAVRVENEGGGGARASELVEAKLALLKRPHLAPPKASEHTASLIFLHGLGDSGATWCDTLSKLVPPTCRVICPNAPQLPITCNQGAVCSAWFDIFGLKPESRQDEPGIRRAADLLMKFVNDELALGICPARILIGGFSQGGAVAVYTALTNRIRLGSSSNPNEQLGGVIALSSWLPLHSKFQKNSSSSVPAATKTKKTTAAGAAVAANQNTPFLQCHGQSDATIPLILAQLSSQIVRQQLGVRQLSFRTYPHLAHCTSAQEMDDVADFIHKVLQQSGEEQAGGSSGDHEADSAVTSSQTVPPRDDDTG